MNKDLILKIAKIKDIETFYKKFPSEEAFMKKHGKEFKKAQTGLDTGDKNNNGIPDYLEAVNPNDIKNYSIGAQTMGKMNTPSNTGVTPVQPVSGQFGEGGFGMFKNPATSNSGPLASSDTNKNYTGYEGAIPDTKKDTNTSSIDWAKDIPIIGGVVKGIQGLAAEAEQKKEAKQTNAVSKIALQASGSKAEESKRRYVTPWDNPVQPNQMFPSYGMGTNPLAKDGIELTNRTYGPGEIQNTYAPEDLYEDLGYEPLNDSNAKQYYYGGDVPQAQWGIASKGGEGFGENPYGSITGGMTGNNAGSTLGGSIGSIFGPIGGAVGSFAGGMLDTNADDIKRYNSGTKRNIAGMMLNNLSSSVHSQHSGSLKDGGYVSHDWTPQVISMFGDHSPKDVYDFAHEGMDSLRTGGNVRQNNMFPQDQYALGGELKTHWGGTTETMSYNPYLPGSGETIMFRGKSHEERSPNGETGIGASYGGNMFEAERNEPMVELEEGGVVDPMTGEVKKSGVVFGNLKIPNQYIDLLGDKSAKGKKFKNYVADLSKGEAKQNKIVEKSTNELNELEPTTIFDKLKLTALQANIDGANMKLKSFADKKINAASLQNAINDTAEENGFDADALAKGKVKEAKFGGSFSKAQNGKDIVKFTSEEAAKAAGYTKKSNGKWTKLIKGADGSTKEAAVAEALVEIPKGQSKTKAGFYGKVTPEMFEQTKKNNPWFEWDNFDPNNPRDVEYFQRSFNTKAKQIGSTARIRPDAAFGEQTASAKLDTDKAKSKGAGTEEIAEVESLPTNPVPYKRNALLDIAGQILPYIRPTDQEPLDAAQLYPEMFAMASNQLQPVQAQTYQPDLSTPYDISYQDQLNANQSDYRATQRAVGYNPAALAQLNAQKYKANQSVLGEQFRANQAMKDKVYGENRNILNDAKLKNLAIYDQQYQRQAQALSNTKATAQAAISSISDKYAKNKLENRTLGVMENMYNYRYDPSGRAINMNAPWQPNIPTVGAGQAGQRQVPVYKDGKLERYQLEAVDPNEIEVPENATPGIVPITEKKRNGSIVKAFKNF